MTAGATAVGAVPARSWEARLHLTLAPRGGVSRVVARHQRGPLALQRAFYPEGPVAHLYLLHPPGGVVGGDTLDIRLECERGAACLATTPGATKFYRGNGAPASQHQRLVSRGGAVEWFPQENIFFDGAEATLRTDIAVDAGGSLFAWELSTFGRPASGIRFATGRVSSEIRVSRDGHELLHERFRLDPARGAGNGAAGLRGHTTSATLLVLPGDERTLEAARKVIEGAAFPCGATLLGPLLVLRCLGHRVDAIRRLLVEVWSSLRPMIAARAAHEPRIWHT